MLFNVLNPQESGSLGQALQLKPAAAIVGALGSRSVQWLARHTSETYNQGIGHLLVKAVPNCVNAIFKKMAHTLNAPISELGRKINANYINPMMDAATESDDPRQIERAETIAHRVGICFKFIIAPLGEELIYRGGVQMLGAEILKAAGLPTLAAGSIAALVGNILFGMAHIGSHENTDSHRFNVTFAAGLAMAVICSQYGLPTSIIAHAIHNASLEYLPDNAISRTVQRLRSNPSF